MRVGPEELLQLVAGGEGRRLELKRGLPAGMRAARTLCAFANTGGGILLVGISDRGVVEGVAQPRTIAARLRELAVARIAPPLAPRIRTLELAGHRVVCCSVPLSEERPHVLVHEDGRRELVVRVGASNRRARGATLRALLSPGPREGSDPLDARVLEWVAQRPARDAEATAAAFAREQEVGRERARRAFTRLERSGRLIGLGRGPRRTYCTP